MAITEPNAAELALGQALYRAREKRADHHRDRGSKQDAVNKAEQVLSRAKVALDEHDARASSLGAAIAELEADMHRLGYEVPRSNDW